MVPQPVSRDLSTCEPDGSLWPPRGFRRVGRRHAGGRRWTHNAPHERVSVGRPRSRIGPSPHVRDVLLYPATGGRRRLSGRQPDHARDLRRGTRGGAARHRALVRSDRAGGPRGAAAGDRAGRAGSGRLGYRVPLPAPRQGASVDAGALHAADRRGWQVAVVWLHQRHHAAQARSARARRAQHRAPPVRLPGQQQSGVHRHVRPRLPAVLRQPGRSGDGRAGADGGCLRRRRPGLFLSRGPSDDHRELSAACSGGWPRHDRDPLPALQDR